MHPRSLLAVIALCAFGCASPSSENVPKEGDGTAAAPDLPIGRTTDATVSSSVAPSTTPGVAVRADTVKTSVDGGVPAPAVPGTDRIDAGTVAKDAWGAEPTSTGERADGSPCTSGADCLSGMCEGQGCGPDEGRCMPSARACTKDLKVYCGCDGKTFRGSGTCPKATFAHKGPCR